MANNLFGNLGSLGNLGGLVKGLSGIMPQDDPAVKLLNAQTELEELKGKEDALFAQLGRQALLSQGDGAYPELAPQIRLVQQSIAQAEAKLNSAKSAQEQAQKAESEAKEARTCPNCGSINDEGVKFCSECGTKLGSSACPQCGAKLQPGARFCGECGAKLG